MEHTYNEGIDKAVHDSQILLGSLLDELYDEYKLHSGIGIIIKNEFRERMEVWSKFEKGEIEK